MKTTRVVMNFQGYYTVSIPKVVFPSGFLLFHYRNCQKRVYLICKNVCNLEKQSTQLTRIHSLFGLLVESFEPIYLRVSVTYPYL